MLVEIFARMSSISPISELPERSAATIVPLFAAESRA
jgi:hypothetical protein